MERERSVSQVVAEGMHNVRTAQRHMEITGAQQAARYLLAFLHAHGYEVVKVAETPQDN